MDSSLLRRITVAAVGLPILLGAVWLGGYYLLALAALVAVLGILELYRLAEKATGAKPLTQLGTALALVFILDAWRGAANTGLLLTLAVTFPLLYLLFRRQPNPVSAWAATVAGALYVGWLLGHALLLRGLADGHLWLLFALLVTFATDTSAYFVGRTIGRHKMAPTISPKKTWEGAFGGVVGAALAALGLDAALSLPLIPWEALALGAAAAVVAALGDLAESMLKRSAGAGEASHLLPGHGGILDRLDSVLFVLPFVYYVVA